MHHISSQSRFVDYSQRLSNVKELASNAIRSINEKFEKIGRPVKIMHVCGTHEATVARAGMRSLLPKDLSIIAGPGCPVCVCPAEHISKAAQLASEGYVICTFGDMFKVPDASLTTLAQSRAKGYDIRVVYSVTDAVKMAKREKNKQFIWLGVGFETTAPMTSFVIEKTPPSNFSILSDFRLVPPAIDFLVAAPTFDLDGFVLPGHVTTVMGTIEYEKFPNDHNIPCVVGGFDPLDFLVAMDRILDQLIDGKATVDNAYPRAVTREGNKIAKMSMDNVYDVVNAKWRGVGYIDDSGLVLSEKYNEFDADNLIDLKINTDTDLPKGCKCGSVILGQVDPVTCPHFLRRCTPVTPIGPCMVSDEGTCRIRATYQNVSVD